jgi:hypothetical protein
VTQRKDSGFTDFLQKESAPANRPLRSSAKMRRTEAMSLCEQCTDQTSVRTGRKKATRREKVSGKGA